MLEDVLNHRSILPTNHRFVRNLRHEFFYDGIDATVVGATWVRTHISAGIHETSSRYTHELLIHLKREGGRGERVIRYVVW